MYTCITPRIKAVGVSDTDIDLFESQYEVPNGITYNSYLLQGDDLAVVFDTVDAVFADQWLDNLADALGSSRQPDMLVVLHLEPDHSGSIARLMERYPSMKLAASAKALAMLPQFFADASQWDGRLVKLGEGSSLKLGGGVELTFLSDPMVHWPEVLVAYEHSEATLFGADSFGTFGTPGHSQPWDPEAARYYFNIVGKFGQQVQALLKKASSLDIKRICSLHGPVLEGDEVARAVRFYDRWSSYQPDLSGVFIPYASVYGNTAAAAVTMAQLLEQRGVNVVMMDLARCDMSEAVNLAFRYPAMLLAAPTYDCSVFPPMATFLHHLSIKGFRNRTVGIIENGSWAPVAARTMQKMLDEMKDIKVVQPVVTIRTRLAEDNDADMQLLADALTSAVVAALPLTD